MYIFTKKFRTFDPHVPIALGQSPKKKRIFFYPFPYPLCCFVFCHLKKFGRHTRVEKKWKCCPLFGSARFNSWNLIEETVPFLFQLLRCTFEIQNLRKSLKFRSSGRCHFHFRYQKPQTTLNSKQFAIEIFIWTSLLVSDSVCVKLKPNNYKYWASNAVYLHKTLTLTIPKCYTFQYQTKLIQYLRNA